MKVLILSHSSNLGGAERSMLDLFNLWSMEKKVQPHFITRLPGMRLMPELKKRHWPYTLIRFDFWMYRNLSRNTETRLRSMKYNARAVRAIENLIQVKKPDVVMTNSIVAPWAALAAHSQKVPHVWFVREYGGEELQFEMGERKTLADVGALSSLVVANSKTMARYLSGHITKDKVTTLYTPFHLGDMARLISAKTANPFRCKSSLKLVITGRIADSKGQDQAVEAVGILCKEGYEVELCVIGTPDLPEDADSMLNKIKEYGIEDRVYLVGHQTNPLSLVALADVGVMASTNEAFGRTTFEYLAAGRPVIGSNSGATPELVRHAHNGFLYKPGDAEDLARQVKNYARDRKLVKVHGKKSRQKAAEMMAGEHNADRLYAKVEKAIKVPISELSEPLNISRALMEYPKLLKQYKKETSLMPVTAKLYRWLHDKLRSSYFLFNKVTGIYFRRR